MKFIIFGDFALSRAIRLALTHVSSVIPAFAGVTEFGTVSGLVSVHCSVQKTSIQKRGTMGRQIGAG